MEDGGNMSQHHEVAVDDDSEAAHRVDNLDSSSPIQNWHFTDRHPLNLILGSQPKDLCFVWDEKEPTLTHSVLEVIKAT